MQYHTWRERDDDGVTIYKAGHHGGRWTLNSQRKGDEDWTKYEPIPDEMLEKLRDLVFNKYQRGRCAWKLVAGVDKLLGREPTDPNQG